MVTATLCLLQDLIEAAEEASSALEFDIGDLDRADPAMSAVRNVQRLYSDLISGQNEAISELRKLSSESCARAALDERLHPPTRESGEPYP